MKNELTMTETMKKVINQKIESINLNLEFNPGISLQDAIQMEKAISTLGPKTWELITQKMT